MKNNETLADILFPKKDKAVKSAHIMVAVGNPNPFVTGQWICPECRHIFTEPVNSLVYTDVCPSCGQAVEFNLSDKYMDSELERYWRQVCITDGLATPSETRDPFGAWEDESAALRLDFENAIEQFRQARIELAQEQTNE